MGVKVPVVSWLVKKAKANVQFLQELRIKKDTKLQKQDAVLAETRTLLSNNKVINKASVVKHLVKQKHGLLV